MNRHAHVLCSSWLKAWYEESRSNNNWRTCASVSSSEACILPSICNLSSGHRQHHIQYKTSSIDVDTVVGVVCRKRHPRKTHCDCVCLVLSRLREHDGWPHLEPSYTGVVYLLSTDSPLHDVMLFNPCCLGLHLAREPGVVLSPHCLLASSVCVSSTLALDT